MSVPSDHSNDLPERTPAARDLAALLFPGATPGQCSEAVIAAFMPRVALRPGPRLQIAHRDLRLAMVAQDARDRHLCSVLGPHRLLGVFDPDAPSVWRVRLLRDSSAPALFRIAPVSSVRPSSKFLFVDPCDARGGAASLLARCAQRAAALGHIPLFPAGTGAPLTSSQNGGADFYPGMDALTADRTKTGVLPGGWVACDDFDRERPANASAAALSDAVLVASPDRARHWRSLGVSVVGLVGDCARADSVDPQVVRVLREPDVLRVLAQMSGESCVRQTPVPFRAPAP